jgi:CDP-diacylglycerol--glycerol-3-phosphate 3-phosphatidyltransferase
MKYIASFITVSRIAGAFVLLFVEPLSAFFFSVYFFCCVSDVIDGYIARKTHTTSKSGEMLDSIADFVLTAVMLAVFVPLLAWEKWMLFWIGAIAVVRFASLIIGFAKYRAFASLHTYTNKVTGVACACIPIFHLFLGLHVTAFLVCVVASLSAFEELSITIGARELNRNRKSIFENGSGQ